MLITSTRRPSPGFTLLEVLIAVVIVGILAAISLPSYQSSVLIGRRGDAKSELLRLAQAETKWRVSNTSYGDLNDIGDASENSDYTFNVTTNTASVFTITATPTSTNGQNNDVCGTLSISLDANINSDNPSECPRP
jgi:type IV pilus assembly protein PilE